MTGPKSDVGNILDIVDRDNTVLIPRPGLSGLCRHQYHGWPADRLYGCERIERIPPPLPDEKTQGDIIYLCSPNNPTGAVYTHDQLKQWVDYANLPRRSDPLRCSI